jgi:hypothetical protein
MGTRQQGGGSSPAHHRGGWDRVRTRLRTRRADLAATALALALLLGLAGCNAGGAVGGVTPVATTNTSGTPGTQPTLALPTLTAAASPSGPGGTGGVGEFCSKPPAVSIHPGSKVPIYPGANLHFSQSNGSNAFYGFCTSASTSDVQNFYALQLRQAGWSGLQTSTISTVIQISAEQCAAQNPPRIIVTIQPDVTGSTTTSISIVLLAGTC